MDLQLKRNESESSEIIKERDKMDEVENSSSASRLENLEAQVNQYFDMKTQERDGELLKLQLKMSRKVMLIRRLKRTTDEYRKELADKDNSLKKLKEHIKRIWNLLFVFRNKLEDAEQLTAKENNELGHEYEEFLSLGIPVIEGKSGDTFDMLKDISEKSTNLSSRSENCVKNSHSNTNIATCTEKNATSSNGAPSVLQSQIITVSSSNDSLAKNYQSLEDNTPQAPKHLVVESSSPCSPDAMNHEGRSYICTKESFSGVFSCSQKSLTDMPPQELRIPLHSGNFTSQELKEIENKLDEMEHSAEERSCTADGTQPLMDILEPLSVKMPNDNKLVEGFSIQMGQANAVQNSSEEKEVSFKMTDFEDALSESLYEDLAMSDDSIPSTILNPGEASNSEYSDEDLPTEMGLISNEQDFQQKVVSPEPVIQDLTLSDDSLEVSAVLSRSTPEVPSEIYHFNKKGVFDSPFKEQGMSLKSVEKDGTIVSDDFETELHNISQHNDLTSSNFQKRIQQSDTNDSETGLGGESVELTTIKSPGYIVATDSKTKNEVSSSKKLVPKEHLDSANVIKEINFSSKANSFSFSNATESPSSTKEIGIGNYITYIKHNKRATKGESRLERLFQYYRRFQFSPVNINQHAQTLANIATNPNLSLDVSVLLFHILNYLQKSLKNPLHSFASNRKPSLLPLDENCIVTALFSMESKKRPHLEGLLRTTLTTTYNLILSKKGFNVLALASLCRFLTEVCKRQGNAANPVVLCADLFKMRHRFAAYLTASVAGVWPELFQIGNKLQAEEVLFHSSILYGASKRNKVYSETMWENSKNIISKYFTAPSVNNSRSAISNMKQLIEIRCKNSSWNSQFLTSALVILAAYEDWDWTEEHLLNKFIIPNLTKFGSETLNEHAFDLFCNLYVDVLLLKPQNPLDTVLKKFFDNSVAVNGKPFVRDSAALALMRFVYQKNRVLPSFLSTWFESNQQNPKVQQIKPITIRRAMSENLKFLMLEDIQQNEDVRVDHPTNKKNQKSDDPHYPGVVDSNSNLDREEESVEENKKESVKEIEDGKESVEEIEDEKESVEEIEIEKESVEEIEDEKESVEEIEVEKDNFSDEEEMDGQMPKDCTLRCRSIRIGSYKVHSPGFSSCVEVILSLHGLSFQAPVLSEHNKPVRIFLENEDVQKIYIFFGRCFRMMSVLTTPYFGELVRKALHMTSKEAQYFDPTTKDDKTQQLTFLIDTVADDQKQFIRNILFGHKKVVEIDQKTANEMLLKSVPKQIQSKTSKITRQSENTCDESEEQSERNTRSKVQKLKGKESLSVQRTNESITDKLREKPSARAENGDITEEGSLFEPTADEESEEELFTTARKRKLKKKLSFLKQRNTLSAGKSEESYTRNKRVKGVKCLLTGRTGKNTTDESKERLSERAKTRNATETNKKLYKRLFTQREEESTTEESEDELYTRGKKRKINKKERKLSTANESEQSSIRNKKRKVEEEESLFKQRTKKFTADESEKELSTRTKTGKSIEKDRYRQKTEESATENSEAEPVTRTKIRTVKSMENLSSQRTEESETDESEKEPLMRAKNRKVQVVERLFKQQAKDSETDESVEEPVIRAKFRNLKGIESLSKQRTEDPETDDAVKGANIRSVKSLENFSKQRTEYSATDESEEESIARAKHSNIKAIGNKDKDSASNESEDLFMRTNNSKIKVLDNLSKQRTEYSKNDSEGEPVPRARNSKVKAMESLSTQKREDSASGGSEEKPVTRAKNRNVKAMELLSKQGTEDSTIVELEDTSKSMKQLKVNWKESLCQQSMKVFTSNESEEGCKSTKCQKKTTKSLDDSNSSKGPVKDIFDHCNLPEGWTRKKIVRKSGRTKGFIDIYYYNSEGYKFRSKAELAAYLKKTQSTLNLSMFDFTRKILNITP